MSGRFENELDWQVLTGALAVWFAHFMISWSISSIFPGMDIVLWLTLAATLAAIAALAALWRWRATTSIRSTSGLAIAVAGAAVAFTFAPALME